MVAYTANWIHCTWFACNTVDGRNPAPPKNHWNDDSCVTTNPGFSWFQSGANGFRNHPQYRGIRISVDYLSSGTLRREWSRPRALDFFGLEKLWERPAVRLRFPVVASPFWGGACPLTWNLTEGSWVCREVAPSAFRFHPTAPQKKEKKAAAGMEWRNKRKGLVLTKSLAW